MNPLPKPRVLRILESTATAHFGHLRSDSTDTDLLDLLAVWLAEVSAEATRRGPAGEPASTTPESTD